VKERSQNLPTKEWLVWLEPRFSLSDTNFIRVGTDNELSAVAFFGGNPVVSLRGFLLVCVDLGLLEQRNGHSGVCAKLVVKVVER
jgi:hypothetical protein